MQVGKYLEKYQPIVYKTFINAINNKQLSHAYLLVGNKGTPLLEVAKYLAKTILCDDPSPMACNNCLTCLRIDDNNYMDFMLFDGEKKGITKSNIDDIELQFGKTAFEKKGIKVYILNCIEYMSDITVNSILKFLEEPQENVFAILTTNNEYAILPTIISRCQTIHLKPMDRKESIKDAVELGVNQEDAELLSYFYNNGELIFDTLNDKDENLEYQNSKTMLVDLLNSLLNDDKNQIIYKVESKIIPTINKKEPFRFFLDLLITVFEDLINIQNNREITLQSYDKILQELANNKLKHLDESLLTLLKQRNMIALNLNIGLQIEKIIRDIIKE